MLGHRVQSRSVGAWVDRGSLVLSWLPCVPLSESSRYFARDMDAAATAAAAAEFSAGRSVDVFRVFRRPVRVLREDGRRSESFDERLERLSFRVQPFEVCVFQRAG